jgi:hypothetical protein
LNATAINGVLRAGRLAEPTGATPFGERAFFIIENAAPDTADTSRWTLQKRINERSNRAPKADHEEWNRQRQNFCHCRTSAQFPMPLIYGSKERDLLD